MPESPPRFVTFIKQQKKSSLSTQQSATAIVVLISSAQLGAQRCNPQLLRFAISFYQTRQTHSARSEFAHIKGNSCTFRSFKQQNFFPAFSIFPGEKLYCSTAAAAGWVFVPLALCALV
jgi:hypothetical protein